MKVFVCGNCGQSAEHLNWRNSFERENRKCCSTCGGLYYERDITSEQKSENEKRHGKWIASRVFWFEVFLGLILLAIFVATRQ